MRKQGPFCWRWKKETNYNGWTAELTPMFDIAIIMNLNFAPFDYMGEVLKEDQRAALVRKLLIQDAR